MRAAFLLACLACSRELTVPPLVQAPKPAAQAPVAPLAAFAGELVEIRGQNLGTASSSHVLFGGTQAELLSTGLDGGTPAEGTELVARVPELPVDPLQSATVAITVQNSVGATAFTDFVYRGPGHPAGQTLRAVLSFAPRLTSATPLGDTFFLADPAHQAIIVTSAADGLTQDLFLVGAEPVRVLGDADKPWVLALTATEVQLRHFDLTGDAISEIAADRRTLSPVLDAATAIRLAAAVSPGGTKLALPLIPDARSISIFDLAGSAPVAAQVVAAEDVVVSVNFATDNLLLGTGIAGAFRVDLGSGPPAVATIPLAAAAQSDGPSAIDAAGKRMAYVRGEGSDVGFISWTDTPGPPTLSSTVLPTLLRHVGQLAFSPDAGRLLASDSDTGRLLAFDSGTLALVASREFSSPPQLVPLRAGPAAGSMLLLDGNVTTIASADLVPFRVDTVRTLLDRIAAGAQDEVWADTELGVVHIGEHSLAVTDRQVPISQDGTQINLGGVASDGTAVVGWSGQLFLIPDGHGAWSELTTADGVILTGAVLSRSATAASAAFLAGQPGGPYTLGLVKTTGAAMDGAPVTATLDDQVPPLLRFGPDASLYVVHQIAGATDHVSLTRYAPGTLQQTATADVPEGSAPLNAILSAWWTAAGLFVDVNVTNSGTLTEAAFVWQDSGPSWVDLSPGDQHVTAVSADGHLVYRAVDPFQAQAQPGLDVGTLVQDSQGWHLRLIGRVNLPAGSLAGPGVSSNTGARVYVTLPTLDAVAIVE